jgi:hypothetical protein
MTNNYVGDILRQRGFLLIIQIAGKTFDINVRHNKLLIFKRVPQ